MSGCCGKCDQGRNKCPHPDLCEQFDGVPLREVLTWLLWPLVVVAVLAFAGWVWRARPWW